MAKKKDIVLKTSKTKLEMQDTVIFMTAYNVHKFKQRIPKFWKHGRIEDLLKQYHIYGISCKDIYASYDRKCSYSVEFDSLTQAPVFRFEEDVNRISEEFPDFSENMMKTLFLKYSAYVLFDSSQIKIPMCFNMENFLVVIDDRVLQVNPVAFMLNGSLIVNFKLIDFENAVQLSHDDIYGRSNNYGIKPISKIKYLNESDFRDDNRKISDIVFKNIYDFINKIEKGKLEVDNTSFVHNTLVISNKINNVDEYFQNVLGAPLDNLELTTIAATNEFEYYSIESLGVVTPTSYDDINHILFDCIMLESFKSYLLLKMIIDYEVNHKLDRIIDSQIYVESLFYPSQVPIITLNVIDNLKGTFTFSRYKQAVDFKVRALKIEQERKRISNGRLMNALLYILALIGSAQTLQVLQTEFQLSFKNSFVVVMTAFVIFGAVWICREFKKR